MAGARPGVQTWDKHLLGMVSFKDMALTKDQAKELFGGYSKLKFLYFSEEKLLRDHP